MVKKPAAAYVFWSNEMSVLSSGSIHDRLAQLAAHGLRFVEHNGVIAVAGVFSPFGLCSLVTALMLAVAAVALSRWRRRGRASLRLLVRSLAFRRQIWGPSGKADLNLFLADTVFRATGLVGLLSISQAGAAFWTNRCLKAVLGPHAAHEAAFASAVVVTVSMFVALDLAHWVDHWLAHRVPAFWELHKVHHTAEALSPLTVFRSHPLETLKFASIAGGFTGVAAGALDYWLGGHERIRLLNIDVLGGAFVLTLTHLRHTHVWISFRGLLGRLLVSPAHHQIHHSSDPRHFNRNLGDNLAVWDWMFGTLHIPSKQRERLRFGIPEQTAAAHTLRECLITPIVAAQRALMQGVGFHAARLGPIQPERTSVRQREEGSAL